jgi:serine/threonine protein kinase
MNTVWLRAFCAAAGAVSVEFETEPQPERERLHGGAVRRPGTHALTSQESSWELEGTDRVPARLQEARAELHKALLHDDHKAAVVRVLVPRLQDESPIVRQQTWQALRLINDTGTTRANAGTGDWRMFEPVESSTLGWDWGTLLSPVGYRIGAGKFGEVVRGTLECQGFLGLRRRRLFVAVKIQTCRGEDCDGMAGVEWANRVQNEVAGLALLRDSPYIIHLLDSGTYPEAYGHAIVMEAGVDDVGDYTTLFSVNRPQFVAFAHDLVAGLQAIHSRGLVHADLKANNLFVLESQNEKHPKRIKIGDFSLVCCSMEICRGKGLRQCPPERRQYTQGNDVYRAGRLVLDLAYRAMRFKNDGRYTPDIQTMTDSDLAEEEEEGVLPEEIGLSVDDLPAEYARTRPYIKRLLSCMLHKDLAARCTADQAMTIIQEMMKGTQSESIVDDKDVEASKLALKECKPLPTEDSSLTEILGDEWVAIDPEASPEAAELLLAIVERRMTYISGTVEKFPEQFSMFLPALKNTLPQSIRRWLDVDDKEGRDNARRSKWEMVSVMDEFDGKDYPISVLARYRNKIVEHIRDNSLFYIRFRVHATPMGNFYKNHQHDTAIVATDDKGLVKGLQNVFGVVGNALATAGLGVADVFEQGWRVGVAQPVAGVAEALTGATTSTRGSEVTSTRGAEALFSTDKSTSAHKRDGGESFSDV